MAEQGPEPTYDRWSRTQALSNRGYVLIVVACVLIAAAGFGVVAAVSAGDQPGSGTSVRLPVSGWTPGDGGDGALISGILRLDQRQCVYLEAGQDGADPGQVWPVWPQGYRATRDGERLNLIDEKGNVVAHDGDEVSMGGGYGPASTFAGEACLPESGEVAIVQSAVTVEP